MRNLDLVEQESIERLKSFWRDYGLIIIICVVSFIGFYGGTRYWEYDKKDSASKAAYVYETFLEKMQSGERESIKVLADSLTTEHKSTPYAALAALQIAKALYAGNETDKDNAIIRLQWAAKNAIEPWMRDTARLQLLQVYLDQKQYQKMLDLANSAETKGMSLSILELKGDALAKLDKPKEAREAYLQSVAIEAQQLSKLGQSIRANPLIRMKINSLPK